MNINVFSTRFGWAVSVGSGVTLYQLSFGHKNRQSALDRVYPEYQEEASYGDWNPDLTASIQAYAEGDPIDFRSVQVDLSGLTDFGQRVVKACRKIPYGQTLTYAELAAAADSPGASRAVGNRMAANRTILVVPCHRVVGSRGNLGGFSGPGGVEFKKKLLELES
jgi:methylated-DNA-[protein]-cysteine S-methyltransferase